MVAPDRDASGTADAGFLQRGVDCLAEPLLVETEVCVRIPGPVWPMGWCVAAVDGAGRIRGDDLRVQPQYFAEFKRWSWDYCAGHLPDIFHRRRKHRHAHTAGDVG